MFGFQLMGSFGASIAIVIALPESDVSRVKSIILGSVISAIIGVVVLKNVDIIICLKVAMAISVAIVLMIATDTFHPPGGAIALTAVMGDEKQVHFSYVFILSPVLTGAIIISIFTLIYRRFVKLEGDRLRKHSQLESSR